jgi:hypothetical protein
LKPLASGSAFLARSQVEREKRGEEEENLSERFVQRVLAPEKEGNGESEVTPEVEEAIQRSRGGGQSLDSNVRAKMESAFGADFSGVRVHTDAEADTLNYAVSARAFTTEQDIFSRQGEYDPGSSSGRELLAHELTHVVQQSGVLQTKMAMSTPDDEHEREADPLAKQISRAAARPHLTTMGQQVKEPFRVAGVFKVHRQKADTAPNTQKEQTSDAGKEQAPEKKAGIFTDVLRRKWIATVLAEAAPENQQQEKYIAWIYYNLIVDAKGESGLNKSTEKRFEKDHYRIWLYMQGEKVEQKLKESEEKKAEFGTFKTVAEVCDTKGSYYTLPSVHARLERVKKHIDDILANPESNPIRGFRRQGYLEDINNLKNDDTTWRMARYYFFLQENKAVTKNFVLFLPGAVAAHSQFLFNEQEIIHYLKEQKIDIKKVDMKYIDVQKQKPVFVDTKDEITAVLKKKSPPKEKPKKEEKTEEKPDVSRMHDATRMVIKRSMLQREETETKPAPHQETPVKPKIAERLYSDVEAKALKKCITLGEVKVELAKTHRESILKTLGPESDSVQPSGGLTFNWRTPQEKGEMDHTIQFHEDGLLSYRTQPQIKTIQKKKGGQEEVLKPGQATTTYYDAYGTKVDFGKYQPKELPGRELMEERFRAEDIRKMYQGKPGFKELFDTGKYFQEATEKSGVGLLLVPILESMLEEVYQGSFVFDETADEASSRGKEPEWAVDQRRAVFNRVKQEFETAYREFIGPLKIEREAKAPASEKPPSEIVKAEQEAQEKLRKELVRKVAQKLAAKSAGTACNLISFYFLGKIQGEISQDQTFADWYRERVKRGRVSQAGYLPNQYSSDEMERIRGAKSLDDLRKMLMEISKPGPLTNKYLQDKTLKKEGGLTLEGTQLVLNLESNDKKTTAYKLTFEDYGMVSEQYGKNRNVYDAKGNLIWFSQEEEKMGESEAIRWRRLRSYTLGGLRLAENWRSMPKQIPSEAFPGAILPAESVPAAFENSGARIAVSFQDTDEDRRPNHYFLIIKDSDDQWVNMDHIYSAPNKFLGGLVNWKIVYALYFDPTFRLGE